MKRCLSETGIRWMGVLLFCATGAAVVSPRMARATFSNGLRMEPQPFRLERVLEGRTFDYNAESFIHRASFAPRQPILDLPVTPDHIAGTAGSTRSDELFMDVSTQLSVTLDPPFFFRHAFRRTEDFDGWYDRNLIGLGVNATPDLAFLVLADVFQDKGRTDLQPEIAWDPGDGNQIRLAVVFTDLLYNTKQAVGTQEDKPVTGFASGRLVLPGGHSVAGYWNETPRVRLRMDSVGYADTGRDVGIEWRMRMHDGIEMHGLAEGGWMERKASADLPDREPVDEKMERTYFRARFGVDLAPWRGHRPFLAMQYLRLEETGDVLALQERLACRREWMGVVGTCFAVADAVSFQPTLFVNHVHGHDLPRDAEEGKARVNGVQGKIALPVDWAPQGEAGARLTVNPTFRLHRAAFGGGNVQLRIPL